MRTPTQIGDEIRRVADLGRRARVVWRETRSLHDEGLAGRARAYAAARARLDADPRPWITTRVAGDGALLWHDDDDRARAMRVLDAGFAGFRADVEVRATRPEAPPATRQWWTAEVVPELEEWRRFVEAATQSWARRAATAWSTYQDWLARLRELRSLARAHDLVLASPEIVDLPETVYQRAAKGRGSATEAWWTIGRLVLYTAVGAVGVISLREILQHRRPTRTLPDPPPPP
jgi:hypothetical protein